MPDPMILCAGNVAALAGRGIDLTGPLANRGDRPPPPLPRDAALRAAAARFVDTHLAGPPALRKPLTLEGIDPPWLLRAVYDATVPDLHGFRPAIRVVQADVDECLDGLARADLRDVLADPRVTVHVGPEAAARYRAALLARRSLAVLGPVVVNPGLRRPVRPKLESVHADVGREQQRAFAAAVDRTRSLYHGHDAAWWARRYDAGLVGGDPLRLVVLSSRFSPDTHRADGMIAAAWREAGCVVELIEEPDDHSCLTPLHYLDAIERLVPDAIVLSKYPRATLGGVLPANVPFICRTDAGSSNDVVAWSGPLRLDYVAGSTATPAAVLATIHDDLVDHADNAFDAA